MALLDLHALAAMVPRGYRLTLALENVSADGVVTATIPTSSPVTVLPPLAERAPVPANIEAVPAPASENSDSAPDDTPLGIARRIAAEQPALALTAVEWAKRLRYSARELTKARKVAGALPSRLRGKGGGKGGRGLVIQARDVERYLQTMRDVATGIVDAPGWYAQVADQRRT